MTEHREETRNKSWESGDMTTCCIVEIRPTNRSWPVNAPEYLFPYLGMIRIDLLCAGTSVRYGASLSGDSENQVTNFAGTRFPAGEFMKRTATSEANIIGMARTIGIRVAGSCFH